LKEPVKEFSAIGLRRRGLGGNPLTRV